MGKNFNLARTALLLFTMVTVLCAGIATRLGYATDPAFGSTINLSNNAGISSFPQIAAIGFNVYVAWQDNSTGNFEIFFRASSDNGTTFGPIINLSNDTGGSYDPEMAVSGSSVYVVWQDDTPGNDEAFFRASNNNGASFGPLINLSNNPRSSTLAKVAAAGNNVYVVWQNDTPKNPDVLFRASNDGGATFSLAINLSNNVGFSLAPEISASLSSVHVVWRDDTTGNDEVYFAVSNNSGGSFGAPVNLSNNTAVSYNQRIAVAGSNVYVTWEDDAPGVVNVSFRASTNGGASFTPSLNLSNTGVATTPEIGASGSGVFVAWRDFSIIGNSEIFYRGSDNNGANFNPKINLSNTTGTSFGQEIGSSGTNVYVVWDDDTPGSDETFSRTSNDGGITFGTTKNLSNNPGLSINPQLAVTPNKVYTVWQDTTPGNDEVFFRGGTVVTLSQPLVFALVNSTLILDNSKVTTAGTLAVNTISFVVSGGLQVTAVDKVSGAATFTKTYTIPNIQMHSISGTTTMEAKFLLNVALLPYALSSDMAVQLQGTTASVTTLLTRQLDINGNGSVDFLDASLVAYVFGSSIGSTKYTPLADFNADGFINILDASVFASYYLAQDLR